jgi:AraC-like DNA-binding protein
MEQAGLDGVAISSVSMGGLTFSETRHSPGARLAAHAHTAAYFCLVRRGGFRERWRHGSAEQTAGDVIFRAAAEEHENVFGADGARCFNVALGGRLLEGLAPDADRVRPGSARVRAILACLCREVCGRAPSRLVAEGLVYQALGEAFQRGAPDGRDWLDHVRDAIEKRFDRPLGIRALAAEVGVHPAHLSRAFHRRFGAPVLSYVRATRVRAAREMLRASDRPLADVAALTGFADQSHLTRVFKRVTGVTPGRYRRSA